MNKKELEIIAKQAAKNIKSESDLNDFRQMLSLPNCLNILRIRLQNKLNVKLYEHHLILYYQMRSSIYKRYLLVKRLVWISEEWFQRE